MKYKFRVARAVLEAMGLLESREHLGLLCRIAQLDNHEFPIAKFVLSFFKFQSIDILNRLNEILLDNSD